MRVSVFVPFFFNYCTRCFSSSNSYVQAIYFRFIKRGKLTLSFFKSVQELYLIQIHNVTLQFLFLIVLLYSILESLVYLKQKTKKVKKAKNKTQKNQFKGDLLAKLKRQKRFIKDKSFFSISSLIFVSSLPNDMMSIDIEVS